jgi:phosphoribosylformimino-5-aminoimidazole carboxamide ribotide isomerase
VADFDRYLFERRYVEMLPIHYGCSLKIDFIKSLEPYCSEFLIHAADKEGLQAGIDEDLISKLAQWCSIDVTYAGGGKNLNALEQVDTLSSGHVNLTIGSALDIFGGSEVTLAECIEFNKRH